MHGISGKNFHRLRGPNRSPTRGRSSSTWRDREKKGRKKREGKKGKKVNKTRQESKQRPSTARSSNNRVAPREEKLLRSSASGARSRAIQGWLSNKTVPRGGGFLCAILKFHASGKYAEGVSLEFNHYAASRSVHAALLPALRAASHCWSASDGEFLEGLDPAGDIPGRAGQAGRPSSARHSFVFGSRTVLGISRKPGISCLFCPPPPSFLSFPSYSRLFAFPEPPVGGGGGSGACCFATRRNA